MNDIDKHLDNIQNEYIVEGPVAVVMKMLGKKSIKNVKAANRLCGSKSGADKAKCIAAIRKKALEEKVRGLQGGMKVCFKVKDTEKCKKQFSREISKIQKQIAQLPA